MWIHSTGLWSLSTASVCRLHCQTCQWRPCKTHSDFCDSLLFRNVGNDLCNKSMAIFVFIVYAGFQLVRKQKNPIQEKHWKVPRRSQHVRCQNRRYRGQCILTWKPSKFTFNSKLCRWEWRSVPRCLHLTNNILSSLLGGSEHSSSTRQIHFTVLSDTSLLDSRSTVL